jgi:putative endonuclease
MASVYILFSAKLNKHYIGSCNDLVARLEEHKQKKYQGAYTKNSDDWELYLSINDLEYKQARSIESHIKRMKSKVYIENLLNYPTIIERLREQY